MKRRRLKTLTAAVAAALLPLGAAGQDACPPVPGPGDDPYAMELAWTVEEPEPFRESRIPLIAMHFTDDDGDGRYGSEGDVADIAYISEPDLATRCAVVLEGGTRQVAFRVCSPHLGVWGTLAGGDVDADGRPELLLPLRRAKDPGPGVEEWIEAYEPPGTSPDWIGESIPDNGRATSLNQKILPFLTDLEGDGSVEILVGSTVLEGATGRILWSTGDAYSSSEQSVGVDLDLDGMQEVVNGTTAYRADGSVYWDREDLNRTSSWITFANLDGDAYPEIVIGMRKEVWILEHDGTTKNGAIELGSKGTSNQVLSVADLTGNGNSVVLRMASVRGSSGSEITWITALQANGEALWRQAPLRNSFSSPLVTYDLDADGSPDVLNYSVGLSTSVEDDRLRVLGGGAGDVKAERPWKGIPFGLSHPIIVDLERDDSPEILGLQIERISSSEAEASVWAISNPAWGRTRSVWNQFDYIPDLVAEDGSILHPTSPYWLEPDFVFRGQRRIVNHPPVADAGPDRSAECASPDGTPVVLDASASHDPDEGDTLTYRWTGPFPEGGGEVEGEIATVTLPLGTSEITLLVDDGCAQDADRVTITVGDTTPPVIRAAAAEPVCLWPPAHRFACFETGELFEVIEACDAAPELALEARSDQEPTGRGQGPFGPDVVTGDDAESFCVRAERDGRDRNGRTYTVELVARDASGNEGAGTIELLAPHDAAQAARDCPDTPVRGEIGPEDRFRPRLPGLPDPLPDPRARRR